MFFSQVVYVFSLKSLPKPASAESALTALGPALELTRMAIQEMGSDDLLLGVICMFLEPCDLHHLLLLLHLKTARKPGLSLSQGALGCDRL